MADKGQGLYILMFSIHGLIRSKDIELGRDADTGGQVKYVLELAEQLSRRPEVERVDLFTRLIRDKKVSPDYSVEMEPISEKARLIRIPCGGNRYMRKELLWPHLDEFIDKTLKYLKRGRLTPYLVHGHYADAGYVAMNLATLFGIPFVFTGHSLGLNKQLKLLEDGWTIEEVNKKLFMEPRIRTEENVLASADLVFTSTEQEIEKQYKVYSNHALPEYIVNPPGIDLKKFHPYYNEDEQGDELEKQARVAIQKELNRFFINPDKPLIFALSRPDKRKNVSSLIEAYGQSKDLQAIANLAVFLGIRKNIMDMEENEKSVLIETLLLMDKYDLYGKLAIPKKHDFTYEVPELYRIAARSKGVFVNPALIEPFGLTLLESAGCGVPLVATDDGGPVDIIKNCNNGILVDVSDSKNISESIKKILVDDELWTTYSTNGINNVNTFYSWEAHVERYLKTIDSLKMKNIDQRLEIKGEGPIAAKMIRLNKMIIVDVDNTLVGDPESLKEFLQLIKKNRNVVGFGVATGRAIDSALAHLKENGVPKPDVLISSVGSEIYYGGTVYRDSGWSAHINQKWEKKKIKEILSTLPFLNPQEPETERTFKVSYFMEPNQDYLNQINDLLQKNKCRYNLIYSHQQYLDVLPQRASKGKAIRYLSYKWEIPLENFLVGGDSGNDEEMLRGDPRGVIVGNFSKEMEILKGKRRIYFSPKNFAAGLVDGIKHYGFLEG